MKHLHWFSEDRPFGRTPRQTGRQTAARRHETGIKNNDSLAETNGTEQGNEIRSLAILTIQCK
jgi:hypothetical protein